MNPALWPIHPRVVGLLASAPRNEFIQRHTITADGRDPLEWRPLTDLAAAFLDRLKREHKKAINNALGYNWSECTANINAPGATDRAKAWAALYASTPSASDALTAEFARRDEYLTWPVAVTGEAA